MKEAILGTIDYHTTMQQIAQNALQRMGGCTPQKFHIPEDIPSVTENVALCADTVIQILTADKTLIHCNPRTLYLFLAWLLIGSDNVNRPYQNVDVDKVDYELVIILIRIAFSDIISVDKIRPFLKIIQRIPRGIYTNSNPVLAYRTLLRDISFACAFSLNGIVENVSKFVLKAMETTTHETDTIEYLLQKLSSWAYISDEEALQIARQLLFDILDMGK